MGYQLWASPITGYRRRGTRLAEFRGLLGEGITARAILEPLLSCPADEPADAMAQVLLRRDFDTAGVKEARDGPVIGFVESATLIGGPVRDHRRELTAEHLISDGTPLPGLLAALKGRQYAFVLMGREVRGIVTRADLNKPPVRVYLFGLVSLLEMHLEFWSRATWPDGSWEAALKKPRLDEAKKLLSERRDRGQDVSLLACLQFCDKRDLVLQKADLRRMLGLGSKNAGTKLLKQAEDLRNNLAHSQLDIAQGSSWPEILALVQSIEELVQRSDERVEEGVARAAGRADELWGSA